MDVLLENDDLKITFEKGTADSCKTIFSFTGISHGLGGIQKEEFVRSLNATKTVHDVYYIIDKRQSWYNATYDQICAFLAPRLEQRENYTLGNSMGGFGALLFSSILPNCKAAIAFCPQYSVNPSIIDNDLRWRKYSSTITKWRVNSCILKDNGVRRFIFYGVTNPQDLIHATLFKSLSVTNMSIFFIEKCGHDVGAFIRDRNLMHILLDSIINSDFSFDAVGGLLSGHNIRYICLYPDSASQSGKTKRTV